VDEEFATIRLDQARERRLIAGTGCDNVEDLARTLL